FLTLSFLALPVIPDVKMTTKGLFDVRSFQHLPIQ
ncbi:adenine deaminase C-terminal domain-containing protein, partial [Bacillus safensis]